MLTPIFNHKISRWSRVVLVILSASIASAQTTVFTYQGKLSDGANPASGNYDFQFKLFDTATVGTGAQQGPTITNPSVLVTAGIFTVQLDLGLAPFGGPQRFLEIGVRPAGSPNPYTLLSPRQAVTSTPYAVRSLNSAVADVLSSACAGCVTSTQVGGISGSVVTGTIPVASVPAGSGDYVQNTTSPQAANFNISGDGTAIGTLSASVVNTTTQYNIGGQRMLSAPGFNNVFAGGGAGNTSLGTDNSFFGRNAGLLNQGSFNSFFGEGAGQSTTTGHDNSMFGYLAGPGSTGSNNSFFGRLAGLGNATGSNNTIIGAAAEVGLNNLTFATAIGAGAIVNNSNSVVLGRPTDTVRIPGALNVTDALNGTTIEAATQFNINGFRVLYAPLGSNAFVGPNAAKNFTGGNDNAFIGASSGFNTTSSQGNSFFGTFAGLSNITGNHNTTVGRSADVASGNLTYATAIGADSVASLSNSIYLGRASGEDAVRIPGSVVIDGTLVVNSLGGAGSMSICLNAVNRFAPCSSSLRYKTSVQTFSGGLDIVRRLRPITFNWKDGGMSDVGFVAEDVDKVEPLLTTRNNKGEIEGVKYGQITTVLVNAVKEQQAQITAQQRTIEQQQQQNQAQQKQLRRQQQQLEALKKLVCLSHSRTGVCR